MFAHIDGAVLGRRHTSLLFKKVGKIKLAGKSQRFRNSGDRHRGGSQKLGGAVGLFAQDELPRRDAEMLPEEGSKMARMISGGFRHLPDGHIFIEMLFHIGDGIRKGGVEAVLYQGYRAGRAGFHIAADELEKKLLGLQNGKNIGSPACFMHLYEKLFGARRILGIDAQRHTDKVEKLLALTGDLKMAVVFAVGIVQIRKKALCCFGGQQIKLSCMRMKDLTVDTVGAVALQDEADAGKRRVRGIAGPFGAADDKVGAFQTDSGLPQPVLYDKSGFVHKNLHSGAQASRRGKMPANPSQMSRPHRACRVWSVTEKYSIIRRRKKEWLSKKFISYIIPTQT